MINFVSLIMENKEIWTSIPNYNGLYDVSNLGNVKSLSKEKFYGKGLQTRKEKILKPKITYNGYKQVVLSNNGLRKHFGVHTLVALAFIPNKENKKTVNHKDCNKLNNSVDNLEWATSQEQTAHAYKNNLMPIGEECGNSKLKESDIIEIRESDLSARKLAPKYNVYWTTIQKIKNRETWKHI